MPLTLVETANAVQIKFGDQRDFLGNQPPALLSISPLRASNYRNEDASEFIRKIRRDLPAAVAQEDRNYLDIELSFVDTRRTNNFHAEGAAARGIVNGVGEVNHDFVQSGCELKIKINKVVSLHRYPVPERLENGSHVLTEAYFGRHISLNLRTNAHVDIAQLRARLGVNADARFNDQDPANARNRMYISNDFKNSVHRVNFTLNTEPALNPAQLERLFRTIPLENYPDIREILGELTRQEGENRLLSARYEGLGVGLSLNDRYFELAIAMRKVQDHINNYIEFYGLAVMRTLGFNLIRDSIEARSIAVVEHQNDGGTEVDLAEHALFLSQQMQQLLEVMNETDRKRFVTTADICKLRYHEPNNAIVAYNEAKDIVNGAVRFDSKVTNGWQKFCGFFPSLPRIFVQGETRMFASLRICCEEDDLSICFDKRGEEAESQVIRYGELIKYYYFIDGDDASCQYFSMSNLELIPLVRGEGDGEYVSFGSVFLLRRFGNDRAYLLNNGEFGPRESPRCVQFTCSSHGTLSSSLLRPSFIKAGAEFDRMAAILALPVNVRAPVPVVAALGLRR